MKGVANKTVAPFLLVQGERMPYKPKHPCSYPGCPKLTSERYCDEHKKLITSLYKNMSAILNTRKDMETTGRVSVTHILKSILTVKFADRTGR